jgi:hypothetical protein
MADTKNISNMGSHSKRGRISAMFLAKNLEYVKNINKFAIRKIPRKMRATGDKK